MYRFIHFSTVCEVPIIFCTGRKDSDFLTSFLFHEYHAHRITHRIKIGVQFCLITTLYNKNKKDILDSLTYIQTFEWNFNCPRKGRRTSSLFDLTSKNRPSERVKSEEVKIGKRLTTLADFGGEIGIRTLERFTAVTRFPVVRLRPTQPSLRLSAGGSIPQFWKNVKPYFSFCLFFRRRLASGLASMALRTCASFTWV